MTVKRSPAKVASSRLDRHQSRRQSERALPALLALPATLGILAALVLALGPSASASETLPRTDTVSEGAAETDDSADELAPESDATDAPPPAGETGQDADAPAESPEEAESPEDQAAPADEEPEASTPPTHQATAPDVQPEAASAAPTSAQAAYDYHNLGVTVSPTSVHPGEDFSTELTGCPFLQDGDGHLLQLPVLNPVKDPDYAAITNTNDVLGGLYQGSSATSADPWIDTWTVAVDAAPGDYRLTPRCQTRETADDPFTFPTGPVAILTVLDDSPPDPSESISPSEGYAGDQFTVTIADCPNGNGPGGISITQSAGDHSGPTPFLTAFDYVSADQHSEPKPYVWEVTNEAAPGEYTLVFRCYVDGGGTIQLNPVTFTVLDDFVFDGLATIDPSSGYPGDEFTLSGTGCPGGMLDVNIEGPPGFEMSEDTTVIDSNQDSGDDPMWTTTAFADSAPPGVYTSYLVCQRNGHEYTYDPVVYTLLERESTPTDAPVSSTSSGDVSAVDFTDDVSSGTQVLPATGSPVSLTTLLAGVLTVLVGGLLVAVSRRRA